MTTSTAEVLVALARWTVQLAQFNGMVADRLHVTQSDLQCLYWLGHVSPATAGELAKRVNLTTGSASRMIDRLHAAGLVTRTPDPHDRRRVLVEATQGSAEVAVHYDRLNDRLTEHLAGLGPDELAVLLRFAHAAEASTDAAITEMGAGGPP